MFKKILVLGILICFALPTAAQAQEESETTVYYLIRHAEKDRSDKNNKNPNLTVKGQARAYNWASLFKPNQLDLVYSTQYNRTIETATPTAKVLGVDVNFYDPRQLYSQEFKQATQGKRVLVVGHSNTTPAFVNAILGESKYQDIDDNNNGTLFIVTLIKGEKSVEVLQIN